MTQPPEGYPGADPQVTSWSYPAPTPPPAPAPAKRWRGRGGVIASAVAVVALAAGGVATYAATSASSSTGSGSPQRAVQKFVGDLNHSDLIGMLDDLPPGERDALAGPVRDIVDQLKRQHILSASADPSHLAGLTLSFTNLTFAANPVVINDHVSVVELTGGHAVVGGDLSKIPLAGEFLSAVLPHGLPQGVSITRQFDIAKAVKSKGSPIRIATEKVGGHWYPSLFYTIADSAATQARLGTPTAADAIPARGASSPTAAAHDMVTAALSGDARRAIELLAPDEMAVMHDYGGLLLKDEHARSASSLPVTITNLTFAQHPVSPGVVRLTLAHVTVSAKNGPQITVDIAGNCINAKAAGQSLHLCASTLADTVLKELGPLGLKLKLTAAEKQAIGDVFTALMQAGTVVTETGGQWYISPVRTLTDGFDSMLKALGDHDILTLIAMGKRLSH